MKFSVHTRQGTMDDRPTEIVERKGLGHPDTLADGVAEAISIAYSRYCLDAFGAVLHHNVDKLALLGGEARAEFGSGIMQSPIRLLVNGRMSDRFADTVVAYEAIQDKAARDYLRRRLPHLDVDHWVRILRLTTGFSHHSHWYRPRFLADIPDARDPEASDTAVCVGYWPLSEVEQLVLDLEHCLYTDTLVPRFPFVGQDVKILAVRTGCEVDVTLCVPLIAQETPTVQVYRDSLTMLHRLFTECASERMPKHNVVVSLNTRDRDDRHDYYLTVTGTALEGGEEGVVGRGNRINGLISSLRPYSIEAPHGKNPRFGTGKVYGTLAQRVAETLSTTLSCACTVMLVAQNGAPLDTPRHVIVELNEQRSLKEVKEIATRVMTETNILHVLLEEQPLLPHLLLRKKGA